MSAEVKTDKRVELLFSSEAVPMVGSESVLLRLPPNLHRRQLLFLDGVRHAAQIADVAYRRLQKTLADVVAEGADVSILQAHAFLDAWAFVDAVHRFRGLLINTPSAVRVEPEEAPDITFDEVMNDVHELRNIADHLPSRVDYIVAKKGPALGCITWIEIQDVESEARVCALVPGTYFHGQVNLHPQFESSVEMPIGCVRLQLADKKASLSIAHQVLRKVVLSIEGSLEQAILAESTADDPVGSDVILKQRIDGFSLKVND